MSLPQWLPPVFSPSGFSQWLPLVSFLQWLFTVASSVASPVNSPSSGFPSIFLKFFFPVVSPSALPSGSSSIFLQWLLPVASPSGFPQYLLLVIFLSCLSVPFPVDLPVAFPQWLLHWYPLVASPNGFRASGFPPVASRVASPNGFPQYLLLVVFPCSFS